MVVKVIATPCPAGDGAWRGWNFAPDDGRVLTAGEVRFTYHPGVRDHITKILTAARRDYLRAREEYWEHYKRSKRTLEYTQAMRAWIAEREKFLREGRELTHTSL